MDRVWESWMTLVVMISSGIGLVALVTLATVPILVSLGFESLRGKNPGERLLAQTDEPVSAAAWR